MIGAYKNERNAALARALVAENKAEEISNETRKLQARADCNLLWLQYKNKEIEKQIAEIQGRLAPYPIEPSCGGYAGDSADLLINAMQGSLQSLELSTEAQYERKYAASRKYQTESSPI